MEQGGIRLEWLTGAVKEKWLRLLAEAELTYEGDPERCIIARDGEEICATASIDGDVMKYVAVRGGYQNQGLSSMAVSGILEDAMMRGKKKLFLFTANDKTASFSPLGFSHIASFRGVSLMEWGFLKISDYANKLSAYKADGKNAAIVMNANPFTLGHRHLIQEASKNADRVHVFMVKENRSVFPFKARYRMVKEGVSDLRNVIVHPGSEYILSSVTFPSYFIKEAGEKSAWQAGLDIKVFQKYICPALDIRVRFVGEEPFDLATKAYNEKMKEILLPEGIEVREIKRLETAGEAVSASRVRKLLSENKSIDHLVPDSTKRYLETEDGKMIIGRLRENGN